MVNRTFSNKSMPATEHSNNSVGSGAELQRSRDQLYNARIQRNIRQAPPTKCFATHLCCAFFTVRTLHVSISLFASVDEIFLTGFASLCPMRRCAKTRVARCETHNPAQNFHPSRFVSVVNTPISRDRFRRTSVPPRARLLIRNS